MRGVDQPDTGTACPEDVAVLRPEDPAPVRLVRIAAVIGAVVLTFAPSSRRCFLPSTSARVRR